MRSRFGIEVFPFAPAVPGSSDNSVAQAGGLTTQKCFHKFPFDCKAISA